MPRRFCAGLWPDALMPRSSVVDSRATNARRRVIVIVSPPQKRLRDLPPKRAAGSVWHWSRKNRPAGRQSSEKQDNASGKPSSPQAESRTLIDESDHRVLLSQDGPEKKREAWPARRPGVG